MKITRSLFTLASLTIQLQTVFGLYPNRVNQKLVQRIANPLPAELSQAVVLQAQFATLPIDHFGSNNQTFLNRYWINDTYYQSGGPVFIYDAGEGNAEPLVLPILQEVDYQSSVMQLTKKYAGLAILWEHRYFGSSLPFPVNINTTGQQWQYLTVEQALEDFVVFAQNFTLPAGSNATSKLSSPDILLPSKTPWIFIGASYTGVRSAVLRVRNPDVVYASWASSAPVQDQAAVPSYYEAIERALPRNCSADWVAMTKYVDDSLSGTNVTLQDQVKFDLMTAHLSGPGGNTSFVGNLTLAEAHQYLPSIAIYLLDPLLFYQSLGLSSVIPFCDRLETRNYTQNASPQSLLSVQGIQAVYTSFLVAIAEVDYFVQDISTAAAPYDQVAFLSWNRLSCNEVGYYPVSDPNNPVSIQTKFADFQYWHSALCNFQDSFLPASPNVSVVDKYGGWQMNPSNPTMTDLISTEIDPWRTLSVGSLESNSPQRNASSSVPKCNTSLTYPSYFGMTYANQVHASDIITWLNGTETNKQSFSNGLALFEQALDSWLPCFSQAMSSGGAFELRPAPLSSIVLMTFVLLLLYWL